MSRRAALQDIKNTFYDSDMKLVMVGGRYGLGSKDTAF